MAKKSACRDLVITETTSPTKKAKSVAKKVSSGKELAVKKVYKKKTLPPVPGETFDDWGNFRLKCVPSRLVNIIKNLSDSQKEAVREIGFGGLLHLDLSKIPSKIVPWFVVGFKDGSYMFKVANKNPKEFLVSKFDVHDCFLLPYGPDAIEIVGTGRSKLSSQPESMGMKELWRAKYNVKGFEGIPLSTIHDLLRGSKEGDDNFKQNFVLFAMSTFLAPTSNAYIDLKILKAVEDVNRISEYDWCSYILNNLSDSCKVFATSPQKKKNLCGCLPLLMISYFQRFDFKGMSSPTTLPLIQHWDDKSLEDRANAEICTGSLGNAPCTSTAYPICQNNAVISAAGAVEKVKSSKPKAKIHQAKAGDKFSKKKFILIPDDVDDDDEIHSKAVDEVHELLLIIQRDSELFHSRYEQYYATMKEKLAKLSTEASMSTASPSQMTPTQAYYNDTEMLRYIDEVVEIAKAMRKVSKDFSKDLSQKQATVHVSNLGDDDIGIGEKVHETIAEVLLGLETDALVDSVTEKEISEERVDAAAEENNDNAEVMIGVEDEVAEQAANVVDHPMIIPRNYDPSSSLSFHPFLLHADRKQSCMVVVPENLGCSEDCGQPIPNQIMLAKFIIDNKALFAPVFSRRLDVMDYCLTDDLDVKEGRRVTCVLRAQLFYYKR